MSSFKANNTYIAGGEGDAALVKWSYNFTERVFKPAYQNFEVILNCGNTDGWSKIVGTLCEPGEFILCEKYTYPSSQAAWVPLGCNGVPINMDSQGVLPGHLDKTLSEWDITHPGVKRPHMSFA